MASIKQLKNDQELGKAAREFFALAQDCVCRDGNAIRDIFRQDRGMRMIEGLVFSVGPDAVASSYRLAARTIKLLGPRICNEDEVVELAWKSAKEMVVSSLEPWDYFVEALEKFRTTQSSVVGLNDLFRFMDGVRELNIGPVRARLGADIVQEHQAPPTARWNLVVGNEPTHHFANSKATAFLPPICWDVTVSASPKNERQEAAWLVNVASSLVRLSYLIRTPMTRFPSYDDVEVSAFGRAETHNTLITFQGTKVRFGGFDIGGFYFIDRNVEQYLNQRWFEQRCEAIFSPVRGSVAERVGRGLGWMARARQTADRAERFLLFFTSIEALITSNDKSVPVVQTIARHVAVVLTNDNNSRHEIARQIMAIYETRSSLVHGGKRDVSTHEAGQIQVVAEQVYLAVFGSVDLSMPVDQFHGALAKASFGLMWPPGSEIPFDLCGGCLGCITYGL